MEVKHVSYWTATKIILQTKYLKIEWEPNYLFNLINIR